MHAKMPDIDAQDKKINQISHLDASITDIISRTTCIITGMTSSAGQIFEISNGIE